MLVRRAREIVQFQPKKVEGKKRKLGPSSTHDVEFQQDGENELKQKKNKEKDKEKRPVKDSRSYANEMVKSTYKASDSDHRGELRSGKLESFHSKLERENEVSGDSTAPMDEDQPAKKSKKERRAERKAAEVAQAAASNNSAPPPIEDSAVASGEGAPPGKSKKNNRNREKKQKGGSSNNVSEKAVDKAPRFIVFIGKLDGHFACSCN